MLLLLLLLLLKRMRPSSGIRTLGVPELTVNKHLKETQTFSFGAALAYDHGLQENKDALAGALYRKSNLTLEKLWEARGGGVALFSQDCVFFSLFVSPLNPTHI